MSNYEIKEATEYKMTAHAIYDTKDLLFECFYHFERLNRGIKINFTIEQILSLINDTHDNENGVLEEISKKYHLASAEYINEKKGIKEYAKICDICCKIAQIAELFKESYVLCKKYLRDRTSMAEASACINKTFELSASLLDLGSSGLLTALMSEQRKLGELLLDNKAGLITGNHVGLEKLEELWNGIQDNQFGSSEFHWNKVNDVLQNAVGGIEMYEAVKWYDAFVTEYGWLFQVIENDDAGRIREQYDRILLMLGNGKKYMDIYDRVCQHMERYNR